MRSIIFTVMISIFMVAQASETEALRQEMLSLCSKDFVQCAGMNVKKCQDSVGLLFKKCESFLMKKSDEGINQFDDCFHGQAAKTLGISNEKIDQCDQVAQKNAPSPGAQTEQAAQEILKNYQQSAKTKNINEVSLPVIANSTVMMHLSPEEIPFVKEIMGGNIAKALPALTLASQEEFSKVVTYYQNKLSQFKRYEIDKEAILLMEKGPKDFNILRDTAIYISTPHVYIEKSDKLQHAPPGTKTKIEIAYRKK